LSGLVFIGWGWVMPHKTWTGVQRLAHVRGFQEFLERAEEDRLERMPADVFHRWLPWAIALGVTERWIFNFQGLKVAAPSWYLSRGDFSLPSFAHDLGTFARRTEEAILTTRRGYADGRGRGRRRVLERLVGRRRGRRRRWDVLSLAVIAALAAGSPRVALAGALGYHS